MNELIKIETNEAGECRVDGRSLHEFLQVGTDYRHWFPRMVEYGFTEGVDFRTKMTETSQQGGRPSFTHKMTIHMAKEICMIQRTDRGKQARQYFIEVEEKYKEMQEKVAFLIPKTFSQALQLAANLQAKIEADADKVAYAEAVTKGDDDKSIGDIAKVIEQEYHVKLGRNRFFEILRNDGLLIKDGKSRNIPTQRAIEAGWFRIAGRTINKPNGDTMETYTVYVTGKGRVYLAGKYGKKLAEEQGKEVTA